MESIEPGSSASVKPARPGSYEDVFPDANQVESDVIEYSYVPHTIERRLPQAAAIYDEPDTGEAQPLLLASSKAPATAENRNKSSNIQKHAEKPSYMRLIQKPLVTEGSQDTSKLFKVPDDRDDNDGDDDGEDDDDGDLYDDVEIQQEPEDLYEELFPEVSSPPPRSSTVPKHLEMITEISLEHLHKLDPKEAQLWMLIQMQKMIQKMEDVHDTSQVSSTKKRQNPPQQKPVDSQEELYVNDFEMNTDQQVTRKDIYVNLDTISEALAGTTVPPVPPRTYRSASTDNEGSSRRDRTGSELNQGIFTTEDTSDPYSDIRKRSMTFPREDHSVQKPAHTENASIILENPHRGINYLLQFEEQHCHGIG